METEYPKLRLPEWFDDGCEQEVEIKQFLEIATVELADGSIYQPSFTGAGGLIQTLDFRTERGNPFIAENDLIVLPYLTIKKIREVLPLIEQEGFFKRMRPVQT